MDEVIQRTEGRSGELVLRRSRGHLEVILNGAFLISTENDASSRAMVSVALPHLEGDTLEVLIGGLGLGYALDQALAEPRVARVTVAELEPIVVRWFREHGDGRAERAAEGERTGRARIECVDVAELLRRGAASYDLVSLDTDNGPAWLVRDANAGLYEEEGVRLVAAALRRGGAAVFWSPDRYPAFEQTLARAFARVVPEPAFDVVRGRRHEYTMYVCLGTPAR